MTTAQSGGDPAHPRLWGIVLAGGQGTRLAPLVAWIHRDGRPKQYAVLLGSRSLLRQTLDRVALAVPSDRTIVVATKSHSAFLAREFAGCDAPKILVQPLDRGTAAGILLPVHWIARRDPKAIVAIFPSDHFIGDDEAFVEHIQSLSRAAARLPSRILLVGVRPDSPESGYGWIEPGADLGGGLRTVRRFWEKPDPETARACMDRGCVWNTFVIVATASAILGASRRVLPRLDSALEGVGRTFGQRDEERAIERAYSAVEPANFSESVLETQPSILAVSILPELSWSDWGTPERVFRTLESQGIVPGWLQSLGGQPGQKERPALGRPLDAAYAASCRDAGV